MSAASPTRPSRRAAARKTIVDDSSDEEMGNTTRATAQDEEDFEPEPARSPRKSRTSRASTAASTTSTAPRRGRPKRNVTPAAGLEPSEVFDPDQTAGTVVQETPVKRAASPRKRKSVAVKKAPELPPPTPKTEVKMEPGASPLGDITTLTINSTKMDETQDETRMDETQATVRPIKALDTVMEKPMDIVLKSRTMVIPTVEETGPRARIVITYLILTNFKSYAGRQEVGPFHASFSSVVGPNGSGKSNVIDSLLFVFGFRASKMRQGKISALIHNSAQYPNLDHCEGCRAFPRGHGSGLFSFSQRVLC